MKKLSMIEFIEDIINNCSEECSIEWYKGYKGYKELFKYLSKCDYLDYSNNGKLNYRFKLEDGNIKLMFLN